MKTWMSGLLLGLILAGFGGSWLLAQQDEMSSEKGKSDTRTVTGCLSKGDGDNEYLLTANDGSTWEIRSSSMSLADHVGHTVSATGVVSNSTMHNLKEDAKDAAHDTGAKKSNSEHGHMKVTDVQMVGDSCSR
jgi:hypothetical protein